MPATKVRVLWVAEMEVDPDAPHEDAIDKLDAFRLAVNPNDYGLSLYCAASLDEPLSAELLRDGWEVFEEEEFNIFKEED